MSISIKTDGKWKEFKYIDEVPRKIIHDQFSHLDEETTDGFFKYNNYWYHTTDFMRMESRDQFPGWDGYSSDSYFSGVLIQLSPDGQQYRIGTYYS